MAVPNTVPFRSNTATAASSGKRKLTNCQIIECVSSNNASSRYHARSVGWNRSGSLLAVACSDATVRLWNPQSAATTTESSSCSITGQGGPMIAATFHPTVDHLLATSTVAGSLRLWDVRGGNTQMMVSSPPTSIGSLTLASSSATPPTVVAVEWNPQQTHILAVTTHDGSVFIYDTRNLSNNSTATSKGGSGTSALLRQVQFEANDRVESCIFDRTFGGQYLLAGVTNRDQNSGMGCIKVCQWDSTEDSMVLDDEKDDATKHPKRHWYSYPAHAGPIYAMAANGTQLATGGADAVVGLWDVSTMACCTALSSRTKYIRSLSFAPDDSILAIATEEDVIELIDCSVKSSSSASRIGLASFSSGRSMHRTAGAEDVAFHPSSQYLLACSRTSDVGGYSISPVSLVKLTIT